MTTSIGTGPETENEESEAHQIEVLQSTLKEMTKNNAQLMMENDQLRAQIGSPEEIPKRQSLISISMIYNPNTEDLKLLIAPPDNLDNLIEAVEAAALSLRRTKRRMLEKEEKEQKERSEQ